MQARAQAQRSDQAKTPLRVPETITVSDDDEETDSGAPEAGSGKPVLAESVSDKPRDPSPVRVKTEPRGQEVKREVKVEVGETEPLLPVKSDIEAPAALQSDLATSIKQERLPSVTEEAAPVEYKHPVIKTDPEPSHQASSVSEESKLCAETLLFLSEFSAPVTETQDDEDDDDQDDHTGFDILFQGLELLTKEREDIKAQNALDLLCSVTRNDTFEYGLPQEILSDNKLDLGLLCSITEGDFAEHRDWVDPMLKLRQEYNLLQYCDESLEKEAKNFISSKIKQFTKDHPETVEEEKYDNIKSLAKMVKKIKNMEIMSQLEVDLRNKITELQNKYRDSQKSLSKLKTPKKKSLKSKKGKQRGPGRPKKKKFPNPKSKMGRPRKHPVIKAVEPKPAAAPVVVPLEEELQAKVKLEDESPPDSDAPPILEPQQAIPRKTPAQLSSRDLFSNDDEDEADYDLFRAHSLLKPPRLTASSPPPPIRDQYSGQVTSADQSEAQVDNNSNISDGRNTTLSTLTSR